MSRNGFPESHSASFALLAYASAYIRAHHPACFLTAMLNCYPLGFYSPATLIKDAQRHGVRVERIDIQRSRWECEVEDDGAVRLGLRYVDGLRRSAGERIASAAPFVSLDDLAQRADRGCAGRGAGRGAGGGELGSGSSDPSRGAAR